MNHSPQQKNHTKLILSILLGMVVFLSIVIYFGIIKPQQKPAIVGPSNTKTVQIDGVLLPQPMSVTAFKLQATDGKAFTENNLQGHWTMMFFGFTNCGMVCPTTLAELNKMYKTLEQELPRNQLPQIVMISVDPDRDSMTRMKEYVATFNKNFLGARANISETVALEKQLHIAAAKIEANGKGKNHYTINHTADILLFNPEGQLQAYLAFPHKAEQMIKDYKLILSTF